MKRFEFATTDIIFLKVIRIAFKCYSSIFLILQTKKYNNGSNDICRIHKKERCNNYLILRNSYEIKKDFYEMIRVIMNMALNY